jgi:hypothetical protein
VVDFLGVALIFNPELNMDNIEQPKAKGGRPKGSKNLRSKEASRVLAQLGFDPIAMLVRTHDDALRKIAIEERKQKPSMIAIAQLLAIQQKACAELMRYGYARTTETQEVLTRELPPLQVTLTPKGWKPGDPVPGQSGDPNEDAVYDPSAAPDEEYPEYDGRPDPLENLPPVLKHDDFDVVD